MSVSFDISKIGLTYEAFEKTAPELSMKLYETKTDEKDSTETSTANLLDLNLKKTVNSTGSFGYNLSGRHIMVDVEVDGKKESVAALVSFIESATISRSLPFLIRLIFAGYRQHHRRGVKEAKSQRCRFRLRLE